MCSEAIDRRPVHHDRKREGGKVRRVNVNYILADLNIMQHCQCQYRRSQGEGSNRQRNSGGVKAPFSIPGKPGRWGKRIPEEKGRNSFSPRLGNESEFGNYDLVSNRGVVKAPKAKQV